MEPKSPPAKLAEEGSPGAAERERAIAHFSDPEWRSKPKFPFAAYKHDQVRTALLKAFGDVCAYCEAPVGSIEIEHFRPKASIRTAAGKCTPGYYWLAADWRNLLPSCHECNTELWMLHPDGRRKSGKGTWFPLEDETERATKAGDEKGERPLLLHPYEDEPADHLEFGEEGVVRPRRGPDGKPSRRGDVTIERLGLNRRGLFDARRDREIAVLAARKAVAEAQERCKAEPGDEELAREHQLRIEELGRLVTPEAGFSAMTAQCVGLV